MQKTKERTKTQTEVEEVPTEVNETSAQVSEDACCVLADIDDLLADQEEAAPTNEWDVEYDPSGERPDRSKWLERFRELHKNQGDTAAWDFWDEFKRRERQWHETRGLEYNSCVC